MRLDDVLDDAEPDAHALGFAAEFGAASIKALENLFMFLRRNAGAVVGDGKCELRGV
jgi:hypothetical protein